MENTAPRTAAPVQNQRTPETVPVHVVTEDPPIIPLDDNDARQAVEGEATDETKHEGYAPGFDPNAGPEAQVPSQLDPVPPEADFSRLEMESVKAAIVVLAGYVNDDAKQHILSILYPEEPKPDGTVIPG